MWWKSAKIISIFPTIAKVVNSVKMIRIRLVPDSTVVAAFAFTGGHNATAARQHCRDQQCWQMIASSEDS